jgi:hypothetical protein
MGQPVSNPYNFTVALEPRSCLLFNHFARLSKIVKPASKLGPSMPQTNAFFSNGHNVG